MTSITEVLPAAFGMDQTHAAPALFVRYAAAALPSVTASDAISSMSPTPTVSGTKREEYRGSPFWPNSLVLKIIECPMSHDEKTDKMDWKNEYRWMIISAISGAVLSFLFVYFNRFPNLNPATVFSVCCVGFYILGILIRLQNHRGKVVTGKTGTN